MISWPPGRPPGFVPVKIGWVHRRSQALPHPAWSLLMGLYDTEQRGEFLQRQRWDQQKERAATLMFKCHLPCLSLALLCLWSEAFVLHRESAPFQWYFIFQSTMQYCFSLERFWQLQLNTKQWNQDLPRISCMILEESWIEAPMFSPAPWGHNLGPQIRWWKEIRLFVYFHT